MSIAERMERVRERIAVAAVRAGRAVDAVQLVAVSKTQSAEAIREAYEAGQRDFGENYVQELVDKAAALGDLAGLRWHMIGHVQTNKAKRVVEVAHVVQTVDSARLARELGKRAAAAGRRLRVLVEVNVGGEESKTGVELQRGGEVVEEAWAQPGLEVVGLMTVPPYELEASEAAVHFARLRALRDALGGEGRLPELSMGMSHDFEEAIAQGATMVRVGTAVFGARGTKRGETTG